MGRPARSANSGSAGPENGVSGNEGTTGSDGNLSSLAAGAVIIDPSSIGQSGGGDGGSSGDNSEQPRKRRGRKPGSRNATKSQTLDISGLEKILLSTHNMLGAFINPALVIDQEEAKHLATASANVARHYDMGATEKSMDWAFLFAALGIVYGPRFMTMRLQRKPKEKKHDPAKDGPSYTQPFSNGGVPITPGVN